MHQLNKGVEIAIILGNNAGKTFAAVARTLNVRKHALFKRCKQACLLNFTEKIGCFPKNFVCTGLHDAAFFIGQLAAELVHGAEDVLRVLYGECAVAHERSVDSFGEHTEKVELLSC